MIKDNLEQIEERLEAAAQHAGRRRKDISLMVVSKTRPVASIQEVYDLGYRLFGENRVHEAAEKFTGRFPDAELHLIGHIQRNKARQAVEIAGCIQSVDSVRTLEALDKHAAALKRKIEVLVEINTGGEESKLGVRDDDTAFSLIDSLVQKDNLVMRGLMTMAPFTGDEKLIRSAFRKLASFRDICAARYGSEVVPILSMGMTNDFEIAVDEGSTMVRVGTAVFGARQ